MQLLHLKVELAPWKRSYWIEHGHDRGSVRHLRRNSISAAALRIGTKIL